MAITIEIRTVDRSNDVDFQSINIQDSMESTGDNCEFIIRATDADDSPNVGNEIIIRDDSIKIFGGIITEMERIMGEANQVVEYNCLASDYTFMLNRRYLNKVYDTASTPRVSTGSKTEHGMIEQILYDLRQSAIADNPLGDYFYNTFYNNVDALVGNVYAIQIGPTIRRQIFQRVAPADAISSLAQKTGHVWWIDFDKRINFRPSTSIWATFLPIVNGNHSLHVETDFINFYDLSVEESIDGIGTKAIIKNAIIRSNETKIEVFPACDAKAASEGITYKLERRPFSELDVAYVYRNRSSVVTEFDLNLDDIARDATDFTTAGLNAFLYVGRQGVNNSYIRLCPDEINVGDIFSTSYQYETNNEHEALDVERIAEISAATGGDGVHEFVFSKGSEIAVQGIEALDEIVEVLLDRKSKILKRGSFTTLQKGWKAGQMFNLVWDREEIDETMWVISVSKRILTPADDLTLNDNIIETQIQYANIPRGLRL
tara:strand:- start:1895 stop:3358 length:1464 start_codon:yes stop_codon:yes gene_type:complete